MTRSGGLLLLTLLLAPRPAIGAGLDPAAPLKIDVLEATRDGAMYRFPVVSGDSPAAARINTYLQVVALRKLPGRYEESPFEYVWPKEGSPHGVTEVDYRVAFEPPGILTVEILGESYGAYASSTGASHRFDARTGEVIVLRDLISADGFAKLDAEITQARLRRVDDFLSGKTLPDGVALRSEPEDAEAQRELYRECRAAIERGHPLAQDRLVLEREGLTLTRDPCAPHVLLALDDLGFQDTLRFDAIAGQLNEYGRCLLVARRTDCPRSHAEIGLGVYRGQIGGRYPITLVIEAVDGRTGVHATYFYDKHAKPIALRGVVAKDGSAELEERGPPPARFALRLQPDGGLAGDWTPEGKAPQTVELR